MTNKKEILNEIKKTEEHLANMKKMLSKCDERWKPKDNEQYWYITDYGTVNYTLFMSKIQNDNMRFKNYNCFLTRGQAENEAEKILIRRQLEDIARRLNKGRTIDWESHEYKFHLLIFNDVISQQVCQNIKYQGTVYCLDGTFKSVAIQEIGEERLKKYLRGE